MASPTDHRVPRRTKTHILIVEDEPFLRDVYRTALTGAGYTVEAAEDGREGLRKVAASTPDLIILDLGLPFVRGEAVLRELEESSRTRHIPVIVATGDLELPPLRARAILRKPFPVIELLRAVERCLRPSGRPQAARLFTRGGQSVRLVRESESDGPVRLLVYGPATAGNEYEFSDVAECEMQEAVIERQLLGEGYELNSTAWERRRDRAAWSGPDRRRETASEHA